jgi:hypothetical protein
MTAMTIDQPHETIHIGAAPERRHSLAAALVGFLSSTTALTAVMLLLSHA